jgi:hypothetical protein
MPGEFFSKLNAAGVACVNFRIIETQKTGTVSLATEIQSLI